MLRTFKYFGLWLLLFVFSCLSTFAQDVSPSAIDLLDQSNNSNKDGELVSTQVFSRAGNIVQELGNTLIQFPTLIQVKTKTNLSVPIQRLLFGYVSPEEKVQEKELLRNRLYPEGVIFSFGKGLIDSSIFFDFGVSHQDLMFSHPVRFTIPVDKPDGTVYEIFVRHTGEDVYTTDGLSIQASTNCADGIADMPGYRTYVVDGAVTFYTCAASVFALIPSGSGGVVTITTPASGSVLYTPYPLLSGTGSLTGELLERQNASGNVIATGIVDLQGQRSMLPLAPLSIGSHTICVSSGLNCTTFSVTNGSQPVDIFVSISTLLEGSVGHIIARVSQGGLSSPAKIFLTTRGTAFSSDYVLGSSVLDIPVGEQQASISLEAFDDAFLELEEFVFVGIDALSGPVYTGIISSGVHVQIQDNDLLIPTVNSVNTHVKISDNLAGFLPDSLGVDDGFGSSIVNIGDLDGDGVIDLAVGAHYDENTQIVEGAIYILFMNTDGTVKNNVKISDGLAGFFPNGLTHGDRFGKSLANIGDLDGDGVVDLAVGAHRDERVQSGEGAIYILFMNTDGTVKNNVKISDGLAGFFPVGLTSGDRFGYSVTNIGDLNNDGIQDLAVGANQDENFQTSEGAIYILFMNADGTVKSNVKISDGLAGFFPVGLDGGDRFGTSIAFLGDFDKDGVGDLVVGADRDQYVKNEEGAIYILFMNADGTVKDNVKISDGLSGFFPNGLDASDGFGYSVANIGDIDGNGFVDLVVGAHQDENFDGSEGAVYLLYMEKDAIVKSNVKISDGLAGFSPVGLDSGDLFGYSVSYVGDLNNDGFVEVAVGSHSDENIESGEGSIYILSFSPPSVFLSLSTGNIVESGSVVVTANVSGLVLSHAIQVQVALTGQVSSDDYFLSSSSIFLGTGVASGSVVLSAIDDLLVEGDETATIYISDVINAISGSSSSSSVTLVDNDQAYVSIGGASSGFVENGGTGFVYFSISSGVQSIDPIVIDVSYTGGALVGTDFVTDAMSGFVVIPAFSSGVRLSYVGLDNNIFEGNKTSLLVVNSVSGAIFTGIQQSSLVIVDDETSVVPSSGGSSFGLNPNAGLVRDVCQGEDLSGNLYDKKCSLSDEYVSERCSLETYKTSCGCDWNSPSDQCLVSWMYDQGFTIFSDVKTYGFDNFLTREQAAKFMSIIGERAYDKQGNFDRFCAFDDLSSVQDGLLYWVVKSCHLGIFDGKRDTNVFLPKDLMTQGHAITVLMKLRYTGLYSEQEWYAPFYDKASELGLLDVTLQKKYYQRPITRGKIAQLIYALYYVDDPLISVDFSKNK